MLEPLYYLVLKKRTVISGVKQVLIIPLLSASVILGKFLYLTLFLQW